MTVYKRGYLLPLPAIMALVLSSCSIPKDAFKLTPEMLQARELKTRKYVGISEVDMFSATAGVLQDLGFNIDESETELGVIVGSKESDATTKAPIKWFFRFPGMRTRGDALDDDQKFWVSVSIRPVSEDNDKTHYVRVTFRRIVWGKDGRAIKHETLNKAEMYQGFFGRLSKSVFLEAQKI